MLTGGCGAYDESEYEPWVRGTTKEGARTLAPGSRHVPSDGRVLAPRLYELGDSVDEWAAAVR